MRFNALASAALSVFFTTALCGQQTAQDLSGTWRFALDRADVGQTQQWFDKDLTTADTIKLPGILQSQGYGDDIKADTLFVAALPRSDPDDPGAPYTLKRWWLLTEYAPYTKPGNIKVPYLAQPIRHYLGVAWYQRDLDIPTPPSGAVGKRQHLFLERPRWGSTVWIDNQQVGTNNSLVAPHEFELGNLAPGKHRLTIRLDNRMSVFPGPPSRNPNAPPAPGYRPDGHSVSDALGQTWNGIVGRIELQTTSPVYIDDAQVFPDVAQKAALIKVHIGNTTGKAGRGTLSVDSRNQAVTWDEKGADAEFNLPLAVPGGNVGLWSEFHPVLQKLTLQLLGDQANDSRQLSFGLREIKPDGKKFLLNGTEINIRSTHSGGDFPLTGFPATDVPGWKKIIQTCKDYGLNGIRFHSWCPPDAAFQAADELGFYLQPECGMWNNFSNPGMPQMLEAETARMMRAYGNHPSYLLLSPSNEPAGNYQAVLPQWAGRWFEKDPRRLYAEDTGRAAPNAVGPTYGIGVIRSTGGWFGRDFSAQVAPWTVPVVSHEVGQWCAYPDFDIIKKFTGYLQPSHCEIYRDSAAAKGVLDRNKEFAYASGKFQVQCYKEEIEANLRTPGLSGFQLLDLHDYLGQGGALIGVLDTFWESKGYCTPEEFRRFCGPTVPLARMRSYVGTTADTFNVPVEIAHFAEKPIASAALSWSIMDADSNVMAQGTLPVRNVPIGKSHLADLSVDLSKLPVPMQYKLVFAVAPLEPAANRPPPFVNSWNFWLYPPLPPIVDGMTPPDPPRPGAPSSHILTTNFSSLALTTLARGDKVLICPRPNELGRDSPQMKNVPVFWNRLMNPSAAGDAMLGLWVDNRHPALAEFPTESFGDWQWIDMVNNVRSININAAPANLRPIVSAIDDWSRNDRLAVLFEANVGPGKLLVSAIDLGNPTRPTTNQLRRSLLAYMASEKFQPRVSLTPAQLIALFPGPNAGPATRPFTPGANPGDIIEGTPPPATAPTTIPR